MSTNNISLSHDDPFYRYKMPTISLKHEGRGNGVKTLLTNLDDVGKSLNRQPLDILQYLASELSVCSNSKSSYVLNGTLEKSRVQELIQKYIAEHVLCGTCSNPETVYIKIGKDTLGKRCQACGLTTEVTPSKLNKKIMSRL
jgi:translation initiation factor 5